MSRRSRIIIPGMPHHVTHRGTRRQTVFFKERDFQLYKSLLKASCEKNDVKIWAYCLMPNHVHLVAVPFTECSLSAAIGQAHKRYADILNKRMDWSGHLWEQRFGSVVMDEQHLLAAVRYVELNPVRARISASPGEYRWSSARAHLVGNKDDLVETWPFPNLVDRWEAYLNAGLGQSEADRIRKHEKTGLPLGTEKFVRALEQSTGLSLRPKKLGRRPLAIK